MSDLRPDAPGDPATQADTPVTDTAVPPTEPAPPPSEAAAEPEVTEPVVKGLDRRRGAPRWLVWVLGVLAVLGIAGTVWFGTQWADLYAAEDARQEVQTAARQLALRLTTFEGAEIEEWFSAAQRQATGEYRQQLVEVFDQRNRDALRDIEVVSTGEIQNLFVQDVTEDTASAFAVVKQTYVNNATNDPVEDQLRIDMTFKRVNGKWLGSEVAVLGPPGALAPTGDPTEPAADSGDQ